MESRCSKNHLELMQISTGKVFKSFNSKKLINGNEMKKYTN